MSVEQRNLDMSELAYELDEQEEGIATVAVIRKGRIACGPVPLPDFGAHRSRLSRTARSETKVSGSSPPDDDVLWTVIPTGADELPPGYFMLLSRGKYIVVDGSGAVIAGPDSNPLDVLRDAWTHYTSGFRP